jgi:hypothetical protein
MAIDPESVAAGLQLRPKLEADLGDWYELLCVCQESFASLFALALFL